MPLLKLHSTNKYLSFFSFLLWVGCSGSHNSQGSVQDAGKDGASFILNGDPDPLVQEAGVCSGFDIAIEITPLNLIITFDISGSMAFTTLDKNTSLYTMCKNVLEDFFVSFVGKGVQASIAFFPVKPGQGVDDCSIATYKNPPTGFFVDLTPLPTKDFNPILDKIKPSSETPTLPAILGVFAAIEDLKKKQPTAHFVHLLISDGEPGGCGGRRYTFGGKSYANDADDVGDVVGVEYHQFGVPTYVIGLGQDLNKIAAQGTENGQAISINSTDPKVAAQQFKDALKKVQLENIPTKYAIPPPPPGKTYNYQDMVVTYQLPPYTDTNKQHTSWAPLLMERLPLH